MTINTLLVAPPPNIAV